MLRVNYIFVVFWKEICIMLLFLVLCNIGNDKEGIYFWSMVKRRRRGKDWFLVSLR